jgi:hypothetical protein
MAPIDVAFYEGEWGLFFDADGSIVPSTLWGTEGGNDRLFRGESNSAKSSSPKRRAPAVAFSLIQGGLPRGAKFARIGSGG